MMLVDRNGRIPVYSENELYVGAVPGEPLSVDTNLQEPVLCAGAANVIEDNIFSISNENGLGYDAECSDTEKIDIGDGTYITLPDPNIQYCEIERNKGTTMTIKLAMGFNCFGGFAGDVDLSFDMHGNIALQASQARFIDERYNTRNIGIIDDGFAGQLQFTNADTVFDLNGNAEYVGFTAGAGPYGGIDAIALPNANGKYDSIDGFQLQAGLGVGVDAHVTRSYTETFGYLNVFDVIRGIKEALGFD